MADEQNPNAEPPNPPHYRWPWFVLAAFVLAVVLAVIWMTVEVRRQIQYRNLNTTQFPQTDGGTKTNSTR
jgi:hypothetical protein